MIRMAYDHGCTFFDTAEIYSPELAGIGHNERIVGSALEGCDAVIATKLHLDAPEVRRRGLEEAVRSHLAGSMERLRIDHLPLYYLHRVNTDIPLEDVARSWAGSRTRGVSADGGCPRCPWTSSRRPIRCTP